MSNRVFTGGLEPMLARKQVHQCWLFHTNGSSVSHLCGRAMECGFWSQVVLVQILTLLLDFHASVSPSIQLE